MVTIVKNKSYQDGALAFENGKYRIALIHLRNALAQAPFHADTFLLLGKTYFFLDAYDKAIQHLNCYFALINSKGGAPHKRAVAYNFLGQCYDALNDKKRPLDCYKKAVRMNASYAPAWHNLGLHHMKWAQATLEENLCDSEAHFLNAYLYLVTALKIYMGYAPFLLSLANWHENYIELLMVMPAEQEGLDVDIADHYKNAVVCYHYALKNSTKDNGALRQRIDSNAAHCFAKARAFFEEHPYLELPRLLSPSRAGQSMFHSSPQTPTTSVDVTNNLSHRP